MNFDAVIHNGTLVTVDDRMRIIENGWIGIHEGVIRAIESTAPDSPPPMAMLTINAVGGIVMPGLVNTHTHLPMTLFRGLADDLPLIEWLDDHIFPAEARFINPETVRWGTLLACAEMLLSGTTCCCGGYFHEDAVARAVAETGLRAVLAQGVIDFPAPGVPDPGKNIDHARNYAQRWKGRSRLITPSIFCHAPYTCSDGTLKAAKAAADDLGLSETEFAFYNILMAEVTAPIGEDTFSEAVHDEIKTTSQDLVGMFDEATQIVDFFSKPDEVKRMKKEIKRAILDCSFGEKAVVTEVQDRFLELAKTKFS